MTQSMDTFNHLFTSDLSLWGLFLSSFLGATILPGGSELVLIGVIKLHHELFWPALIIATIGNTLGGMVTFGMGWLLPQRQDGNKTAVHPTAYSSRAQTQQLKHIEKLRRHGTPALLLAWAPIIGDALCLTAGWLRFNPWHAALFMALGKFTRYALLALGS
jgi:membrane protein YqaA with SNARE-associated domain